MSNSIRTTERDNKLKEFLGKDVFNQLDKSIAEIENSIPTTKNHYGRYMSILSPVPNRKETAMLLIYLGANHQGIADALKLVGVE